MWFLEVKNCLMAKKSVYLPKKNVVGVEIKKLDYEYFPGFSLSQKQKSINCPKLLVINKYITKTIFIDKNAPALLKTFL